MTPPDFEHALRQAKLEALAEFAAGAGHEINNPLATILGRTDLLLRRINRLTPSGETAEASRDLNIIAGQVQRIRDMIGDLMLIARPPAPKLAPCDLADAVRTTLKTLAPLAAAQDVALREELAPGAAIKADPTQLAVVISELVRNALHASRTGGMVRVSTSPGWLGDRQAVRLLIEDSGTGLTETDQSHLFDPFYSGRQAGRGLGFGLCKCWRIVQMHGGAIEVTPREEGGVRAMVDWPAA